VLRLTPQFSVLLGAEAACRRRCCWLMLLLVPMPLLALMLVLLLARPELVYRVIVALQILDRS
jgi:hypothetical protein